MEKVYITEKAKQENRDEMNVMKIMKELYEKTKVNADESRARRDLFSVADNCREKDIEEVVGTVALVFADFWTRVLPEEDQEKRMILFCRVVKGTSALGSIAGEMARTLSFRAANLLADNISEEELLQKVVKLSLTHDQACDELVSSLQY